MILTEISPRKIYKWPISFLGMYLREIKSRCKNLYMNTITALFIKAEGETISKVHQWTNGQTKCDISIKWIIIKS